MKYELIFLTESIDLAEDIAEYLFAMSKGKQNLVKTRLVVMDQKDGKGLAFGRNLGAALADSSTLLFVDDDAMILDDIAPIVSLLQTDKCQGAQPLLVNLDAETIDSAGDYIKKVDRNRYNPYCRHQGVRLSSLPNLQSDEIPYLRGAFMVVKKEVLLKIGGFDSTFLFNYDDVDFGFRLTCAGYKLLFIPQVKAVHKGSRTSGVMSDRLVRLSVLNTHAMYLKIAPYYLWPYIIFAYFERSLLRYELSRIRQGQVSFVGIIRDLFMMNKLFIGRVGQARIHRDIIGKFGFVGREKLDAMARGERFLFHE